MHGFHNQPSTPPHSSWSYNLNHFCIPVYIRNTLIPSARFLSHSLVCSFVLITYSQLHLSRHTSRTRQHVRINPCTPCSQITFFWKSPWPLHRRTARQSLQRARALVSCFACATFSGTSESPVRSHASLCSVTICPSSLAKHLTATEGRSRMASNV